jgi:hypothetical protein
MVYISSSTRMRANSIERAPSRHGTASTTNETEKLENWENWETGRQRACEDANKRTLILRDDLLAYLKGLPALTPPQTHAPPKRCRSNSEVRPAPPRAVVLSCELQADGQGDPL